MSSCYEGLVYDRRQATERFRQLLGELREQYGQHRGYRTAITQHLGLHRSFLTAFESRTDAAVSRSTVDKVCRSLSIDDAYFYKNPEGRPFREFRAQTPHPRSPSSFPPRPYAEVAEESEVASIAREAGRLARPHPQRPFSAAEYRALAERFQRLLPAELYEVMRTPLDTLDPSIGSAMARAIQRLLQGS